MLAICQHNAATYYAQNYAGIIGASLCTNPYRAKRQKDLTVLLFEMEQIKFSEELLSSLDFYIAILYSICTGGTR